MGDISNYGQCSSCDVNTISDDAWVLELEDIEKNTAKVLQYFEKKDRVIKGVRHCFKQGDLLFSKLRTYLNKVFVAQKDGYCSTEIIPVSFFSNITPQYICFVLKSNYFLQYSALRGYGVKMPRIGTTDALHTFIPLPPINEQRKIISKVQSCFLLADRIDEEKKKLEIIIKIFNTKTLSLAVDGHLVAQDPKDQPAIELLKKINPNFKPCDNSHYKKIPINWELCYLQDVCNIERGVTFPASAKSLSPDKNMIPCVRTANVQDRLDLSNLWYIDKRYINGNIDKLVEKDDIILSSANSRELVGKTSYVYKDEGDITFGGFVLKIRSRGIDSKYLFFFLRYTYLSNIFKDIASQTTNIANISTHSLSNLVMAVPPLEEQKRISQTVKRIFTPLEKCVFEINN